MIKLNNGDNGGKVELRVEESIEVQLPENPTTGYRWQLNLPVGPVLEVEDNLFARPYSGTVGAGGLHNWRFSALQEGIILLKIENRRSWEPQPVGTFEVTIEVKAS